ncbi:uncharacterized protein LOC144439822 [Glandiceps talaboti]
MATTSIHVQEDFDGEGGDCQEYPRGFEALLECLTTEILFQQPFNVYQFAADYIDGLLDIRDVTGRNPLEFLSSATPDERQHLMSSFSRARDTPETPYTEETLSPSPRLLLDSQMTEISYDTDSESAYTEPSNFSRELSPSAGEMVIPGIPGVFYNYMLRKGFFQELGERSG